MYTNKYGLKFGCDPEIFSVQEGYTPTISDHDTNLPFALSPAVMSSEFGFSPIDKEVKHPLYLEGTHHKIIGDGVAYEINLKGPCDSPSELWEKVNLASMDLQEKLLGYGCNLYKKPTVNFDYGKYWKEDLTEDEYWYWSTIFGCDPDIDAFNTSNLCLIEDVSHHPFRYGGGHLHFSGNEKFGKYPKSAIKLFAVTVGNYINSKTFFTSLEKMRAKYYGKPGKYRVQRYKDSSIGLEYRTPSNSWLNYTYEDFERIFYYVDHAMYLLENNSEGKKVLEEYGMDTVTAITNVDKNLSADILNKLNI